jgi:hypothetical protein
MRVFAQAWDFARDRGEFWVRTALNRASPLWGELL